MYIAIFCCSFSAAKSAPLNDVVVNGKSCVETEAGTYVKGLTNLLPILPINVGVEGLGIEEEYAFGIQFSLGNVGLYVALIAAIVVLYTKGILKKP